MTTHLPRAAAAALTLVLATVTLGDEGPSGDAPGGDAPEKAAAVSFGRDVAPILKRHCVECHGISKKSAGLRLDRYDLLVKGSRKGPILVAGKSGESKMIARVSMEKGRKRMPPEGKGERLTAEEIAVLTRWIDAGAPAPAAAETTEAKIEFRPLPSRLTAVFAVAGNPAGDLVAVGRGAEIRVSRIHPGGAGAKGGGAAGKSEPVATLSGHRAIVQTLEFSPDGALLASGGFREVILWSTSTWKEVRRLGGLADRVLDIDFSADGALLAACGGAPSATGEIVVWETATGKRVASLPEVHSDTIFSIDFSPDHARIATGSADRVVGIVDLKTGKRALSFDGHTHHVTGVRFSPDGKRLVSCGADAKIKSWDLEKRAKIRDWNGHGKAVTGIDMAANGAYVASVSGDHTLRLWNLDGKQLRSAGDSPGYLHAVDVFGGGKLVATAGQDGVVRIYDAGDPGKARLAATLPPPAPPASPAAN